MIRAIVKYVREKLNGQLYETVLIVAVTFWLAAVWLL